jgi:VanZ family protein
MHEIDPPPGATAGGDVPGAPRVWLLLAVGATLAFVLACLWPADRMPHYPTESLDKLHHGLAFLVLGYAWRRARFGVPFVLLFGVLLALGTEMGQAWMHLGRDGEPLDVVADLVGLLLALALASALGRGRSRQTS